MVFSWDPLKSFMMMKWTQIQGQTVANDWWFKLTLSASMTRSRASSSPSMMLSSVSSSGLLRLSILKSHFCKTSHRKTVTTSRLNTAKSKQQTLLLLSKKYLKLHKWKRILGPSFYFLFSLQNYNQNILSNWSGILKVSIWSNKIMKHLPIFGL